MRWYTETEPPVRTSVGLHWSNKQNDLADVSSVSRADSLCPFVGLFVSVGLSLSVCLFIFLSLSTRNHDKTHKEIVLFLSLSFIVTIATTYNTKTWLFHQQKQVSDALVSFSTCWPHVLLLRIPHEILAKWRDPGNDFSPLTRFLEHAIQTGGRMLLWTCFLLLAVWGHNTGGMEGKKCRYSLSVWPRRRQIGSKVLHWRRSPWIHSSFCALFSRNILCELLFCFLGGKENLWKQWSVDWSCRTNRF